MLVAQNVAENMKGKEKCENTYLFPQAKPLRLFLYVLKFPLAILT